MASVPEIFQTMAYGPAPEGVGPATQWLEAHGRRFGLFIGGKWTSVGGETFETLNPANGKPLARLTQATAADVDRAIRAARADFPDFRIFHGTEADILPDGSIDYGDDFLGNFDLVVASVHSRFALPRDEQTKRLIRAVENPRVSVLGHLTGRLLLTRKGIDVDVEAVLDAAARSGCAVEINGSPHRLDLDWRFCRAAAEKGLLFSIGPDAHSVKELEYTAYAVGIARKGWVTPASTLNAKSAEDLAAWLERRRGTPLPR